MFLGSLVEIPVKLDMTLLFQFINTIILLVAVMGIPLVIFMLIRTHMRNDKRIKELEKQVATMKEKEVQ